MNAKAYRSVFGLAVVLAMTACLGIARSSGGSVKSFEASLTSPAKLSSGEVLEAGNYRIAVLTNEPTAEVAFYQGAKLVAKTQAKVEPQSQKNEFTEIETTVEGNTEVITSLAPAGWREKLTLGN